MQDGQVMRGILIPDKFTPQKIGWKPPQFAWKVPKMVSFLDKLQLFLVDKQIPGTCGFALS